MATALRVFMKPRPAVRLLLVACGARAASPPLLRSQRLSERQALLVQLLVVLVLVLV